MWSMQVDCMHSKMNFRDIGFTVIFLISLIQRSRSSGKLEVKFISYYNTKGLGYNGHCCDGKFIFCPGACDHVFTLCVDRHDGTDSLSDCKYGKHKTGEVVNRDTIPNFGNSIGGVYNYFVFKFSSWPGSVKIKVFIEDADDNVNDYVETLIKTLTRKPTQSYSKERIHKKTRLELSVKVSCDANFYNSQCSKYCLAQNDPSNGFYTCNKATGEEICKHGWTGEKCKEDINECLASPCHNNSTCNNIDGSYKCVCQEGYSGVHCEVGPICDTQPCLNGATCTEDMFRIYTCFCAFGYSGNECETRVDPCTFTPCLNNGSCDSSLVTFEYTCSCSPKWLGDACDISMPPVTPITLFGDPSRITLLGEINDNNRPALVEGLRNISRDLGNIPGVIFIQVETTVFELKPGTILSEVDFLVAVNNSKTVIDQNQIDRIFTDNERETINSYLPLPLYYTKEGIPDAKPSTGADRQPTSQEGSWSSEHWYIFFLMALICIAALAVFGFLFIRRRRSKEEKKENIANDFPAARDMSFENVLYHENNQTNDSRENQPTGTHQAPNLAERPTPTESAITIGASAQSPDNAYDIPKPANYYQDIDDFTKPEPPPPRCNGAVAGPYLDMNGTAPRSVDNTYQDFNKLAVSMKDIEDKEENHYQDLDKVKEEIDSDVSLSSDSEDEIAKIKSTFA